MPKYRNRDRCRDYRLVAIYPSQVVEQSDLEPHQFLIQTDKLIRIYLDELGDIEQLPIGLSLMVLTTLEDETAMQAVPQLVDRAKVHPESHAIMDMISSILIYKFTNLSRDEVAAMIAVNIQESRAYQEIKAEGVAEGVAEGLAIGKQELVLSQLGRKLKTELSAKVIEQIQQLSIGQLDNLAEALLDFSSLSDLSNWLDNN